MENNKLYHDILNFLKINKFSRSNESLHVDLGKGVEILFKNKSFYSNYQSMKDAFCDAKRRVLQLESSGYFELTDYSDNLLIEMEAVLINDAGLPNFWNSSLKEYIEDEFFKIYYKL